MQVLSYSASQAVEREGADAMQVRLGALAQAIQAQLHGFKTRTLRNDAPAPAQRDFYLTEWRDLDKPGERTMSAGIVGGTDRALNVTRPVKPSQWELLSDIVVVAPQCSPFTLLYLAILEASLSIVQVQADQASAPLIWMLTTCSEKRLPSIDLSTWGLARSARAELTLPLSCLNGTLEAALTHSLSFAEPELVLNQHSVNGSRLNIATLTGQDLVHLHFHSRGAIANLFVEAQPSLEPLDDTTVVVRVRAVGLNFRDVLNVLGEYPGDPGPPGGDMAGVLGADAAIYGTIEDAVLGLGYAPLSCMALALSPLLARMPTTLGFEQACTLPVTWSTTHTALERARLRTGCSIVVHAAAGGVGLASIEYVHLLRAVLRGTAGRPHKHSILVTSGVGGLSSSREGAAFAVGNSRLLNACRSHAVLNSLSLDFIAVSFASLCEGGACEEIGKRSIWSSERHSASTKTSTYCAIALDLDMALSPAWIHGILVLLASRVDKGCLTSLQFLSFELELQYELAFRTLQSGLNTGKIVVRIPARHTTTSGVHVVTGGTGGLGLLTGRWLAQRGAKGLHLASRSGKVSRDVLSERTFMQCMTNSATQLHQCDMSERWCTRRLMALISSPDGLWHAAGVLADGILSKQSTGMLSLVYSAKADAASSLHSALNNPVCAFVMFSSVATLFGGAGQANYSAANASLDALAAHRVANGRKGASLQWGPWAEVGMAARGTASERMAVLSAEMGIGRIGLAKGLAALSSATRCCAPSVMAIMSMTWSLFLNNAAPAFLSRFAPRIKQVTNASSDTGGGTSTGAANALSLDTVLEMVKRIAGNCLDADAPLMENGVDSLGTVELRNQLLSATGQSSLPSTLVFDYPTARQIASKLEPTPSVSCVLEELVKRPSLSESSIVTLGGTSAMFPARVLSPQCVHRLVASGQDAISEVPKTRWDMPPLPEPFASRARHGGFVNEADFVDNIAFGVSPAEAAAMDPCQRAVLERAYAALHEASLERASLAGTLTGVFLGISTSEFGQLLAALPAGMSVHAATGSSLSIACGRLAYVFGLHGPCASYDTACSAALVACHSGYRALQLLECGVALAAAVSLMLTPTIGTSFAVAGMTSAGGRSFTFDVRADGYVRGEGCGSVALSRGAEDSTATLQGSAVRQDGRSASLTAPNGQAQQGLILAALKDADMRVDALVLNEAHGTGTALGDPIEAGSLAASVLLAREEAYSAGGALPGVAHADALALGGVKANIGHAEPAAGITGLLKLVLGLRRTTVVPNSQLRALNPHVSITLEAHACVLSVQLSPVSLESGGERAGGLSSFGYGGTIVHAVFHDTNSPRRVLHFPLLYRRHSMPFYVRRRPQSDAIPPSHAAPARCFGAKWPSINEVLKLAQTTTGGHVDADAAFMDAGLDSHGAVELRNMLSDATGGAFDLPETIVFDFPTPRRLSAFGSESGMAARMPALMHSNLAKVAQVMIAAWCPSLPHGVKLPHATRSMVSCGHDAISEIPAQRWVPAALPAMPDTIARRARHGGFVEDIHLFDNRNFRISNAEAVAMDPQHRGVLENGYAALRVDGSDQLTLDGSGVGVFIGIQALEFPQLLASMPAGSSVYAATGAAHSIACGRVSFVLGLQGPCTSYDTACSAGLVASHAARSALSQGECGSGLAVGVNLNLLPAGFVGCAVAGMTSVKGRCHTFDDRADGYSRSEGCVAVILDQLAESAADGRPVVCGSAVRQDGKSASLTAPNGQAQQGLRLAARAHVDMSLRAAAFVEAHGTGTALGDPMEAGSYAAVAHSDEGKRDALGSIKANVGHSEPAAGTSGLLKLAVHLDRCCASPNAQLRVLNPLVESAIRPSGGVLHAQLASLVSLLGNVSSFGFGGTIAHALLSRSESLSAAPPAAPSRTSTACRRQYPWQTPTHPFIELCVSSDSGNGLFRSTASGLRAIVTDHVVQGRVIFPGTGHLELARAACCATTGRTTAGLSAVFIVQPLVLQSVDDLWIECSVSKGVEIASGVMETGTMPEVSTHCKMDLVTVGTDAWRLFNLAGRRSINAQLIDSAPMYSAFNGVGLMYGPEFRRLSQIWMTGAYKEVLSRLHDRSTASTTQVHPADLDCTQHLEALLQDASTQGNGGARMPFSYDQALLRVANQELFSVRLINSSGTFPYVDTQA